MNNKTLGNGFEKELAKILSKKGYWVTILTPKRYIGSQPADLIAIKDNKPTLIDCKTCKTHLFPISRIEANQWNASKKYFKCGNLSYVIAIQYKGEVYMVPIETIDKKEKHVDLNLQMRWGMIENEDNS